jgi:hypothetical protein
MNVQITCGPPHLNCHMSPRDMQMFEYCAISGEVWAGYVSGELEACWGVIPPSFMSDQAYLWMLNLPVKHPIILGRYSRKVMDTLLFRWPTILGHCRLGSSSMRWLLWLGAEFGQPQSGLIPFSIRRPSDG